MPRIEVSADPSSVGLDPGRLERVTSYFDAVVATGRLAGWQCVVGRDGEVAWVGAGGHRDVERGLGVEPDTIWRLYSMTKPVTSIAVMMLHEEGRFDLNDEVAAYLPEFADTAVYVDGPPEAPVTRPVVAPMRIWHLLTHTAGLTYGFQQAHPVDAIYRARGYEFGTPSGIDLAQATADFASMPLLFDPGTSWNYSVATDVLGRLVEVLSGMAFDEFLSVRIFEPLGMTDTGFSVPEPDLERLAELYLFVPGGTYRHGGALGAAATRRPGVLSGGGGLVSTAHDYHRFCTMLLQGGALDGVRVVSPSTIGLMSRNHLPADVDLETFACDSFSETSTAGVGFGLGFSVVIDQARLKLPVPEGTLAWGGAASTTFWVDPVEDLTCAFYTQLLPSSSYPIRREVQRLVYQAVID